MYTWLQSHDIVDYWTVRPASKQERRKKEMEVERVSERERERCRRREREREREVREGGREAKHTNSYCLESAYFSCLESAYFSQHRPQRWWCNTALFFYRAHNVINHVLHVTRGYITAYRRSTRNWWLHAWPLCRSRGICKKEIGSSDRKMWQPGSSPPPP